MATNKDGKDKTKGIIPLLIGIVLTTVGIVLCIMDFSNITMWFILYAMMALTGLGFIIYAILILCGYSSEEALAITLNALHEGVKDDKDNKKWR